MKKLAVFLFSILAFLLPAREISAENNKFITVVNPVRVAPYSGKISENLAAQYKIASDLGIPATWLITYDVLNDSDAVKELLSFESDQEIGLFLEVGSKLATNSGVALSKGSWQFANVVFLSGYTQEERIKLIDTLFEKFKEKFGYYPKSVGSWWTDSFSLNYMYTKYDVIANLTVADQFSTDRYQVWGGYWAMPYYSTKYHSAIPASNVENKIPVVITQWAPRDPINGYYNSLFSTQDYHVGEVNEDIGYFEKILSLYLNEAGDFGQVTIGLEGDLTPEAYYTKYQEQLKIARRFNDTQRVHLATMSTFASWYKDKYKDVSPVYSIYSPDLLGKNIEVIWYQSPKYRVGILSNRNEAEVKFFDMRVYDSDFYEPYFEWPNRSFNLSINVPSIYDEAGSKESALIFENDVFENTIESGTEVSIELRSGKRIKLDEENIEIFDSENNIVQLIKSDIELDEYNFRALTLEATHALGSKKLQALVGISLLLLIYFLYRNKGKRILLVIFLTVAIVGFLFYRGNTRVYWVSQGEVDVLRKLKEEPNGRVLVYDSECLQCEWYSDNLPAVFANKRNYVEKLTGHKVIFNKAFFEENDLEMAKQLFKSLNVDYIYLVSYGGYSEDLPVSPGDIDVEKVYANANAQIWKVKND